MKAIYKTIIAVVFIGMLSACAHQPGMVGYYGSSNSAYGQNSGYGYGNYANSGYRTPNYGNPGYQYSTYGNPGYGYPENRQYQRGEYCPDDDD